MSKTLQDFCTSEALVRTEEHLSPSGKHRLVIEAYKTGKGTWDMTKGSYFEVETGKLIAETYRNYHRYPFCWVEDHPQGDFALCGENYMSQTLVDLRAGKILPSPLEAGFCWSSMKYHPTSQTVLVDGCYWASSYETRLFDLTDIRGSWPELLQPLQGTIENIVFNEVDFDKFSFEYYRDVEPFLDELRWSNKPYEGEIPPEDKDKRSHLIGKAYYSRPSGGPWTFSRKEAHPIEEPFLKYYLGDEL